MLEFNEVCFSNKDISALKDISLKIEKGEAVALIGPDGSGKSTFLKLINGIIYSQRGTYEFDGNNISEKAMEDGKFSKLFHKKIGLVFQNSDSQLFCSTVQEERYVKLQEMLRGRYRFSVLRF